MSRVNANSTLRVEDYPAAYRKDLLPRLFQALNLILTQVIAAINGGIEFGSNIPSQDDSLEFSYAGVAPTFKWNLNRSPKFVLHGQAFEDGQPVVLAYTWSFDSSRSLISLDSLLRLSEDGLSPLREGAKYEISLRTLS